ncbi:hypothetical protein Q0Z83_046370 [Actinoplanes sichuanensis]|nr:hypothetical protein Q0Z83_046370 [Actinoplanes sichuanensis]
MTGVTVGGLLPHAYPPGSAVLTSPAEAAASGDLDALMRDPEFLLAWPPEQILRHRHTLVTAEGVAAAAALDGAAQREADDRRWWLHVWARRTGATALAEALAGSATDRPWRVRAGFWSTGAHRRMDGLATPINALTVLPGPGGRPLVAGAGDRVVRVWDPDTGGQVGPVMTGHKFMIYALVALPRTDGSALIVSGGDDRTVRVWDPETGAQIGAELTGHVGSVRSVAVLPTRIVSGGEDGSVRLWDLETGAQIGPALTDHGRAVRSVAVLPRADGRSLIVAGGNHGTLGFWDPETGTEVGPEHPGHTGYVWSVTVTTSRDGRPLIASGGGGDVWVWDPETGEPVGPAMRANARFLAALSGVDGRPLIATAYDMLQLWDPETGAEDVQPRDERSGGPAPP